jgi:hypothetical protein
MIIFQESLRAVRQLADVFIFNDFPLGINGEKSLKIA